MNTGVRVCVAWGTWGGWLPDRCASQCCGESGKVSQVRKQGPSFGEPEAGSDFGAMRTFSKYNLCADSALMESLNVGGNPALRKREGRLLWMAESFL